MKSAAFSNTMQSNTAFLKHDFRDYQDGINYHTAEARQRTSRILATNSGANNVSRPKNEFSRTYRTETVLGNSRKREYSVSISAEPDELEALAERFNLAKISKLDAELVLRNDSPRGGGGKGSCIRTEGTITATVTQTCVRTNKKFDEDVTLEIFAAVKPCRSSQDNGLDDVAMEALAAAAASSIADRGKKKKGKTYKNKSITRDVSQFDEIGMKNLQDLMEDFDVEDDIIEDESIFSNDGVLDAGELVAQHLCLKLDPYPKMPGTKPINLSFSG